jgi:hypothetical protein
MKYFFLMFFLFTTSVFASARVELICRGTDFNGDRIEVLANAKTIGAKSQSIKLIGTMEEDSFKVNPNVSSKFIREVCQKNLLQKSQYISSESIEVLGKTEDGFVQLEFADDAPYPEGLEDGWYLRPSSKSYTSRLSEGLRMSFLCVGTLGFYLCCYDQYNPNKSLLSNGVPICIFAGYYFPMILDMANKFFRNQDIPANAGASAQFSMQVKSLREI